MIRLAAVLAAFLAAAPALADLTAARAEPNLEKRSRMALDNAEQVLRLAKEAYSQGDIQRTQAALEELRDSVLLAHESLRQTGKNPSRSPKHFKHAEIKTRGFLRQLGDFRETMSWEDRDALDQVRAAIEKVHQELLLGIMGGKKKK